MTKTEYLAQLDKYLKRLPQADYQEAMDYFVEYFEEAGPENEATVIAELGTPKEAASDIISTVLDKHLTQPKNRTTIIGIIILSIFAAPIGLPFLIFLVLIMLILVHAILAIILATYILGLAGILLAAVTLFESFSLLTSSFPSLALGIGASLLVFGASLLAWIITTVLAQFSGKAIVSLWQKIIGKRRTAS